MTLKASHGYSLSIYGFSDQREGRDENLALMMAQRRGSAVQYATKQATVTEDSIQAVFGDVGEVDVNFQPSGHTRTEKPACQPDKPVSFDSGFYEGKIEFHGEDGYSEASATRARGDLQFLLDIVCPSLTGESFGPGLPGARLAVRSKAGALPRVELRAVQNRPTTRVRVGASIEEEEAGMQVLRAVSGKVPATTFDFDHRLRSARLSPPAPFSGSGIFHRYARNPWSGNLSVDFPGRPDVSLVGPGMRAGLARAAVTKETVHHPED